MNYHANKRDIKVSDTDKESARYLAELLANNPDQFLPVFWQIVQQRVMEAMMQTLTGMIEACLDDFDRRIRGTFDEDGKGGA